MDHHIAAFSQHDYLMLAENLCVKVYHKDNTAFACPNEPTQAAMPTHPDRSPFKIFTTFLGLGLTSFGGPAAHIAYFRTAFVQRRAWLSDADYAEIVALCQFLPGPSSSQVGIAIGMSRAGWPGAFAAWLGFTLPSALLMILIALGLHHWGAMADAGLIHGLKIAALAVIVQAILSMAPRLCPDAPRIALATLAGLGVILLPTSWIQVAVIAAGGLFGVLFLQSPDHEHITPLPFSIKRRTAVACLTAFGALLLGLPLLAKYTPALSLKLVDTFFRVGSLVFGGGHVVLPLLQAEVVPQAWISKESFFAGYGAAQAMPGPLFSFAAFLGANVPGVNPWFGGILCLLAIFAPSFLLMGGALPFWAQLRHYAQSRAALAGINATVIGLLLAVVYQPTWHAAIHGPVDAIAAGVILLVLQFTKVPPWLVVIVCACAGSWI